MRVCLLILSILLVSTTSFAQEFQPKSAKDCLERFKAMFLTVNQNYAVVGSAEVKSLDKPGLSMTYHWFAIENSGEVPARKHYYESQIIYPHAILSNAWEKRYILVDRVLHSYGNYNEQLKQLERNEAEDNAKYQARAAKSCLSLYTLAVWGPTSEFSSNSYESISLLDEMTMFNDRKENEDFVGTFYGSNFVKEIKFAKLSGFMPTNMRTYFYKPAKPGVPVPEEYTTLWVEAQSNWQKLENELWVPTRVHSTKHRNSPTSTVHSKRVEATSTWKIIVGQNLVTDENVMMLAKAGPIASIRNQLMDEAKSERGSR